MTPDDITAELSDRLRSRGAKFDPAALQAFAADLRDQPESDVEELARRFNDWQRAVRGRKRAKAWVEGACLAGIGLVISGIGALGVLYPIIDSPFPAGYNTLVVSWFLVTGGITAFGAALVALGLFRAVRASRRLAAEAEQVGDSDAPS